MPSLTAAAGWGLSTGLVRALNPDGVTILNSVALSHPARFFVVTPTAAS